MDIHIHDGNWAAVVVAATGVIFAALCVWLTVRIVNRHKKPGWIFWATVGLTASVLYVLSVGPVRWMYFKTGEPEWLGTMMIIYDPIWWAFENGPHWLWWDVLGPYVRWWTPR